MRSIFYLVFLLSSFAFGLDDRNPLVTPNKTFKIIEGSSSLTPIGGPSSPEEAEKQKNAQSSKKALRYIESVYRYFVLYPDVLAITKKYCGQDLKMISKKMIRETNGASLQASSLNLANRLLTCSTSGDKSINFYFIPLRNQLHQEIEKETEREKTLKEMILRSDSYDARNQLSVTQKKLRKLKSIQKCDKGFKDVQKYKMTGLNYKNENKRNDFYFSLFKKVIKIEKSSYCRQLKKMFQKK